MFWCLGFTAENQSMFNKWARPTWKKLYRKGKRSSCAPCLFVPQALIGCVLHATCRALREDIGRVLIPQELSVMQTSAGIKVKLILILVGNKSRTGNLHLGKKSFWKRLPWLYFGERGLGEMIRSLKERQMLSGPTRYYYTATMLVSTTGEKRDLSKRKSDTS